MPAEWEPHAATWLSWPHNIHTWPGMLDDVEVAMVSIVAALAESETVRINVLDEAHERHVRRLLEARTPVHEIIFHRIPTNDAWCRDHGPIFVVDSRSGLLALDFEFNAWGGKYSPYDADAAAGKAMAAALGVAVFEPGMVLEGGSVDVDGAGRLLTTDQCLLNPNRNPQLDRAAIEARLENALGVSQIAWLVGGIDGDDTDGHVDGIARFVACGRVVAAVERDAKDPNHRVLSANLERLKRVRPSGGKELEVVELPMPEPLYGRGRRLPASYANFLVANEVVLVPQFGCRQDAPARDILGACFAGRRTVPVDCRGIVIGLGAVHCLTQQVPLR